MPRATIYARISSDTDGTGLGVARQEADCRRLCADRGWEVTGVHVDNDRSAYKGTARPGYQALMDDLRTGAADAVVAWHPDRLHRSPRELEDFVDLVEQVGATVVTVQTGTIDLSTPAGRMAARMVGTFARYESEHKSARVRRKHLELAEAGAVVGGGARPYGFEADKVTVRPEEAEVIRWATAQVLAGRSLYRLVMDLGERKIPTAGGGAWQKGPLRKMLLSGRIAGLREHHGQVTATAVWPAIIQPHEHQQLRAILLAPRRREPAVRRYLLTASIGFCGLCGSRLYGRPHNGRPVYYCPSEPGLGCGHIMVVAAPVEALVTEHVLAVTARMGPFQPPVLDLDRHLREIAAVEARKQQLAADFYVTGDLTDGQQFRAASAALEDRLTVLRTLVAEQSAAAAHGALVGDTGTLATRWPGMALLDRVAVLHTLGVKVFIDRPTSPTGARFDPRRVRIEWAASTPPG